MRFSLSTLIGAVLLIGLYLAAARLSSTLAAQAALTLTVALLVVGLVWGLFRPEADRWFWIGFELCGWAYLLLAFSSWSQAQLSSQLLSTHLLAGLHSLMPFNSANAMVEWGGSWWQAEVLQRAGGRYFIHYTGHASSWDEWVGPNRIRGHFGPFLYIGHSFVSLIMALAGGTILHCLGASGRIGRWLWLPAALCAAAIIPAGVAAVLYNNDLASSIAVSLLLVVLFLTTLAALAPSTDRTCALGFCLIGWGYVLLHLGPVLETSIGPQLLTTTLLQTVNEWLHPPPQAGTPPGYYAVYPGTMTTRQVWTPSGQPAAATSAVLGGHALLALLLAVLGGWLALCLARRKPVGAAESRAV
jgi:hypothetical protein